LLILRRGDQRAEYILPAGETILTKPALVDDLETIHSSGGKGLWHLTATRL
jgi:hypothetical protein